ncbi:MAG: hypothetical protein ACE5F1_12310 [Planctomycetota bacterium]
MEAYMPDPSRIAPAKTKRLTPAQKQERLAILARQKRLEGSSEALTDTQCARRLGLKVPTWIAWKRRFLARDGQDPARARRQAARGAVAKRRTIQRLSEDQERRRRAVLERQDLASTNRQMRMTDQQCADSVGISRHAWISWKKSRRLKEARSREASREAPQPTRLPGTEELADQVKQMIHHTFDRGERAIACLQRIRELIDRALGEDRR